MKELSQFLTERLCDESLYNEQCESYLVEKYDSHDKIIQEGVLKWIKSFWKRTTQFVSNWINRGGKKVNVGRNDGKVKISKPATQTYFDIHATFNDANNEGKIKSELYPYTKKYLDKYHVSLRPNGITENTWNKMSEVDIIFEPNNAFINEKYPIFNMLYSEHIHFYDKYIHIFAIEMSSIAKGVTKKELFEYAINNIINFKKYDGLTLSMNNPQHTSIMEISQYKYKNFIWETLESNERDKADKMLIMRFK
ncbi:MAG: hypothetical protein J6D03_10550 [Clostridia bacterium]|nr:hypothetical protein [Clostridia bacterium]